MNGNGAASARVREVLREKLVAQGRVEQINRSTTEGK